MAIIIGEAIFGEKNRQHSLIAASPAARIASEIVGQMDLPGTLPPGTTWEPCVSGFLHGDFYIIARTALDPAAKRAGMAFSRAFFLSLDDAAKLDDISGLFAELEARGEAREVGDDISWGTRTPTAEPNRALAYLLLNESSRPVVWPMQAGFSEAIAGLWRHLWPAARLGLSFGLAFRQRDLAQPPPTVVAIPAALAVRWSNFSQVHSYDAPVDDKLALLLGLPAGEPLRRLIAALGASITIDEVGVLAEIQAAIDQRADFGDLIGAMRAAAYLSADPKAGREVKHALIDRAVRSLDGAQPAGILMARNFDTAAFADDAAFWKAVAMWCEKDLWAADDIDAATRIILSGYAETGPVKKWRDAVQGGIGAALSKPSEKIIAGIWRLSEAAPILGLLLKAAPSAGKLTAKLVAEPPRVIAPASATTMLNDAASAGEAKLHAVIAASAYAPAASVRAHLDSGIFDGETLRIAIYKAKPKQRVDIALGSDEAMLFEIAGEAAAADPRLLRQFDAGNPRWREIWRAALALDIAAWEGPASARQKADALWDELASGASSALTLLTPLAATPLGDISRHPARVSLWPRIPDNLRPTILERTADSVATAIVAGDWDESLEEPLAGAVSQGDRRDRILAELFRAPAQGVALFRLLPQLDEAVFRSWCEDLISRSSLSAEAADAIGRLVAARGWNSTAMRLISIAYTRSDLVPALRRLSDYLHILDKFYFGVWGSSDNRSKWPIFEEIAKDLYPLGPDQDNLWGRAGGKRSNLPDGSNGGQRWQKVIEQARKGKLDIDMSRLVSCMLTEYPGNPGLRKLRAEKLF